MLSWIGLTACCVEAMLNELWPLVGGALLVAVIFFGFWLRGRIQASRRVDPEHDFILLYEVGLVPKLASILGVMIFFVGALQIGTSNDKWLGVLICVVGLAGVGVRYYLQRKFVFSTGVIRAFRGASHLGDFELDHVSGFVRVDHSGGVSLLGLKVESPPPDFLPRPTFFTKSLFTEHPDVAVVFSSEGGRVHADALLNELTARMPKNDGLPVHRIHHAVDLM